MSLKLDYNPFDKQRRLPPFLAFLQKLHSAVVAGSAPCNQVAATVATAPSAA